MFNWKIRIFLFFFHWGYFGAGAFSDFVKRFFVSWNKKKSEKKLQNSSKILFQSRIRT
jgi:hypothetical protein